MIAIYFLFLSHFSMNADIIATLASYLIRPQQRRIFAILCKKSADDIIPSRSEAYKGFAEYCNSLRKHRDISGMVMRYFYKLPHQTLYIRVKYYDITGYSYDQCIKSDSNIYNFYHKEIRFSLYNA